MSEVTMTAEVAETEVTALTSLEDLKPKMKVKGTVTQLELYGAFIDIGVGTNALIHISNLGVERVNRVADVLSVGSEVEVWVDKVDPSRNQVMVTMIQPLAVEWSDLEVGQAYTGRVSRMENFGAFVDIGAEREGLVHISEISHDYIKHPSERLKVESEVQVQVLGFSKRKRRIDLSIKALEEKPEEEMVLPDTTSTTGAPRTSARRKERSFDRPTDTQQRQKPKRVRRKDKRRATETVVFNFDDDEELPTAMEIALRRAMGDDRIEAVLSDNKKNKKRRRRDKSRNQQEDIMSRTLQMQGPE